jgi:hypothetical protein
MVSMWRQHNHDICIKHIYLVLIQWMLLYIIHVSILVLEISSPTNTNSCHDPICAPVGSGNHPALFTRIHRCVRRSTLQSASQTTASPE